jgi:2-polyprenyl-6-hydroxyphenyl methylase/3-demethylubiquinone-9 3-methyltransferase
MGERIGDSARRLEGNSRRFIIPHMTETVNADPAELAKFSELAHRWWDLESEFRPLHEINPLRLEWIESIAPIAGRKVLDVGCGGGILADAMARRGGDVLGIDLADKALKVAQLHALEAATRGVKYRGISVEALAAEQPESFDVVTCMEMLEHVPQPASVVQACARLAKPGGWVFFSTRGLQHNPITRRYWLSDDTSVNYMFATRKPAPAQS